MLLRRHLVRLLAALPLAAALAATGAATPAHASGPSPTWTAPLGSISSTQLAAIGAISQPFSSPAVGDLQGNGQMDVVTGGLDGAVRAFNATTGQQLWADQTGGAIQSSPTLADLGGNGQLETIVTSRNGYINVYGPTGQEYPGWPVYPYDIGGWNSTNFGAGFFGSAAVGSLFGNGALDIVATGLDHRLYAWNASGGLLPGFPINLWDTSLDTPTLVDLLGNGQLDIVVGSDSSGASSEPYPIGGVYWAYQPDGHLLWVRTQNEVPWGSSAAGVLNPGDTSPSIVGATGNWVHQSHPSLASAGQYLNVFTTSGANRFSAGALTTPGSANFASPAIGDILNANNGSQEIVDVGEDTRIYAWDGNGTLIWETPPVNEDQLGSPIIAPLGNGACGGGNGVWMPGTTELQGWCEGASTPAVDITTPGPSYGAPTVANLGNGQLSLIDIYENSTANTGWTLGVWPLSGTSTLPADSWPTFHGSAERAGTQAVAPNPQDPTWVGNLYHDLLGRTSAPASSEINYWVDLLDNGATPAWVANQFVDSTEAHTTIVDADYATIFGSQRTPDPSGLAYWVGQLNAGVHNETLLGLLGGSTEFYADHGNSDPLVVQALYKAILNRTVSLSDPGLTYWVGQLQARKVAASAIGDSFANSHEYHMDVVNSWYVRYLGRPADPPGQVYWADYLDAGNSDDAGILQLVCSAEYFGHPSAF